MWEPYGPDNYLWGPNAITMSAPCDNDGPALEINGLETTMKLSVHLFLLADARFFFLLDALTTGPEPQSCSAFRKHVS